VIQATLRQPPDSRISVDRRQGAVGTHHSRRPPIPRSTLDAATLRLCSVLKRVNDRSIPLASRISSGQSAATKRTRFEPAGQISALHRMR